ncbi:MAG TPA: glycogen debranching N-terminal domain-containing protein [Alphaproteobacteria bacterium]|nr:glycogen debranching N-terminal domain-containing protein [Alphaproteobacteria bacterium]
MSEHMHDAHTTEGNAALSPQDQQERKRRVLTQGTPAIVRSIADALVIKRENIFFLTEPDGSVPLADDHGLGLYYHDCRYLNGYELKLSGAEPHVLVSTAERGFMAVLQLTNPDIRMPNGRLIHKDQIGVKWERVLEADRPALHDLVTLQNFGLEPIEFAMLVAFQAGFEDVYAVRELLPERLGTLRQASWQDGALSFIYAGKDGVYRGLVITFVPGVRTVDGTTVSFRVRLNPRESQQIRLLIAVAESPHEHNVQPVAGARTDPKAIGEVMQRSAGQSLGRRTQIRTDSLLLNSILERSFRDLEVLRSTIKGDEFFAAGVPWFSTLFGRDSLITALQTLAYRPEIAEQTLWLLARYQSRRADEWRDAQPGKILHELRIGEMAHVGEIPHTPYYGTIDATPLFLILLVVCPMCGQASRWYASLARRSCLGRGTLPQPER